MFKNSPLFIQKIMTLIIFSFLLSCLIAFFDLNKVAEHISTQTAILMVIGLGVIFTLIEFLLVYFCIKRKRAARIILTILIVLGILGVIFALITEELLIVQNVFYALGLVLDIYTLVLLFGTEAKNYFDSGRIQNHEEGSFKTWFSTLSSILLVVMMGAKFLNKYDSKHQIVNNNTIEENEISNESSENVEPEAATTEATDVEVTEEDTTVPTSNFERLDCKDPDIVVEFTDTINSSPIALSNNLRVIDVDTDYIEEISFTNNPYELQCSVMFTLNDGSDINYLMRIYDKNGKGKMMIEGEPLETDGE